LKQSSAAECLRRSMLNYDGRMLPRRLWRPSNGACGGPPRPSPAPPLGTRRQSHRTPRFHNPLFRQSLILSSLPWSTPIPCIPHLPSHLPPVLPCPPPPRLNTMTRIPISCACGCSITHCHNRQRNFSTLAESFTAETGLLRANGPALQGIPASHARRPEKKGTNLLCCASARF
jgi:hypothetical protein